ncbi:hypothetical protein B2J93_2712 [Marssonina coronariae]|uniref:Uncharacterized protein n=1 Tax=Diplocarpon coronariae TaxID=2795749 RepID=A0A218Z468_9HELO|nr:hypothetical protein B2J93_2712 [Marssonina coronariae]
MMYENSGLEPSGREDVLEEAMFRSFRIYELKSVNSIPTAGEIDYTRKFSGSYHWSYDFEHQSAATRGPIKSPEIVLAHAETLVRAALEPLNSRAKGISVYVSKANLVHEVATCYGAFHDYLSQLCNSPNIDTLLPDRIRPHPAYILSLSAVLPSLLAIFVAHQLHW